MLHKFYTLQESLQENDRQTLKVFNAESPNVRYVVDFIEWVMSDTGNYTLFMYGIDEFGFASGEVIGKRKDGSRSNGISEGTAGFFAITPGNESNRRRCSAQA